MIDALRLARRGAAVIRVSAGYGKCSLLRHRSLLKHHRGLLLGARRTFPVVAGHGHRRGVGVRAAKPFGVSPREAPGSMVLTSLLPAGQPADDGGTGLPGWEGWLIQVSFLGLGLGLAIALPLYLRERWPAAFAGRLGADATGRPTPATGRQGVLASTAMVAAVAAGALGLYWVAGGTLGLQHPDLRVLQWRLLVGNAAIWSFAGAWALWALTRARPGRLPRWVPVTVSWVASGFLFAWSCWKLLLTVYLATTPDPSTVWPERLAAVAAQEILGIVGASAMLAVLIRTHRTVARSRA